VQSVKIAVGEKFRRSKLPSVKSSIGQNCRPSKISSVKIAVGQKFCRSKLPSVKIAVGQNCCRSKLPSVKAASVKRPGTVFLTVLKYPPNFENHFRRHIRLAAPSSVETRKFSSHNLFLSES
jgi:hypothetical protein